MPSLLSFARFQLDPSRGQLQGQLGPVPLTPKALALLEYLASRPGRLVSKRELLDAVWPGVFVADGALKVCIREIRRALGDDARAPQYIETAHRRGYRFIAEVNECTASAPTLAATGSATVRPLDVHYAHSGGVNIAYQVVGDGPVDLVFVMGWVSHVEYFWLEPSFARFLQRLAGFSRLILFDKRGTGLSDPVTRLPTLEERMQDVSAVLEAVGSRRAVLMGVSEGGPMCSLYAATYPAKTEALIMIGTYARRLRSPDYPWGPSAEERDAFCADIVARWGGPVGIEERAPTAAHDPAFRSWWATFLRMGASPAAAVALTRMNADIDVRHILPTIRVPTLVLHRSGDRCLRVEEGRFVASLIPGARFVELAGDDHLPFVGDQESMLHEIEAFVTAARTSVTADRVLATILCTESSGKGRGRSSLDTIRPIVTTEAQRAGAMAISAGKRRIHAVFDGPARAIRCACAISDAMLQHGLDARLGLHTGECDVLGGQAEGVAVEIAARVAALAGPSDVLVSRTVVDLVAGSGLRFEDRGSHALSANAPDWRVFAVQR
jgi:pimeloyl-ACP methyl ester carboxylesterase/DNA-binding winged helix-turn-helix (wHTH) protein